MGPSWPFVLEAPRWQIGYDAAHCTDDSRFLPCCWLAWIGRTTDGTGEAQSPWDEKASHFLVLSARFPKMDLAAMAGFRPVHVLGEAAGAVGSVAAAVVVVGAVSTFADSRWILG